MHFSCKVCVPWMSSFPEREAECFLLAEAEQWVVPHSLIHWVRPLEKLLEELVVIEWRDCECCLGSL